MSLMPKENKMTILPLHLSDWGIAPIPLPIQIADDLTLDSIEGILQPSNFDLWRDYVAKKDRDDLSSTKAGVIHRFVSEGHIGKPEVDSQDRIYKTFVLLRLIRPTNERYSNIQVDFRTGASNVFGFTQPTSIPNTPNTQTFNRFHAAHFAELSRLLPKFMDFLNSAPRNLIRAVRMFESGYSEISDPLLQFVSWTIGVESLFSNDQRQPEESELVHGITKKIGPDTNIYSEAEVELFPFKPDPITVGKVLPDIIESRNRVIHGVGVPERFDQMRLTSPATAESIHYVDVLREAASFILRKLILLAVEDRDA